MKCKVLPLLALLFILPTVSLPVSAQTRDNSWEFGPYLTANNFDNAIEIEDQSGGGFRFGYNFKAMHEIEFLLDGVDTEDSVFHFIDVKVGKFQVNYVLNLVFDRHQTVIPFVTAGVGTIRFEADDPFFGSDEETDDLFNLGGGVRFFFGKRFNIRFDARAVYFEGDDVVLRSDQYENTELTAGAGWVLGGR